MNEPIKVLVAGEAAPFRKKVATWNARDGRSGTHAYDEKKYANWKDAARYAASQVMGSRPPVADAIEFVVKVYFQIPESFSGVKVRAALAGALRPVRIPDADNLCKAAADAMTGIVIRDDKYIVRAVIEKWYSDRPRVEIEVSEVSLPMFAHLTQKPEGG